MTNRPRQHYTTSGSFASGPLNPGGALAADGTPTAPSPPDAPPSLSAAALNGAADLTWPPAPGAATYRLLEGTSSGGESGTPVVTGLTGTSYRRTGLTNGTAYFWQLEAVNGAGHSGPSPEATATPAAAAADPSGTLWAPAAWAPGVWAEPVWG